MPDSPRRTATPRARAAALPCHALPGQVVLVLQGGGALGAYQVGVYRALHEAGIEPDWVIGTSIGAINAALIAGNPPAQRMQALDTFWDGVRSTLPAADLLAAFGLRQAASNLVTLTQGIPGFFAPNAAAWAGTQAVVGVEAAAYYDAGPLRRTLASLVDFERANRGQPRLSVGAVDVRSGQMRYFDSRDEALGVEHVMASGALPPAFPAVAVDGQWYWDGGVYSNTPIEAVLDDQPRRSSVIFAATVWQPSGDEPQSIAQAMTRLKDIQYASRSDSHLARQRQIHRLRHVIRELHRHLPERLQADPAVRELAAWGCGTTMHVLRLQAPRLPGEDHTKDIDFSAAGIDARRQAGFEDTREMLARAPWNESADPIEGVVEHAMSARETP